MLESMAKEKIEGTFNKDSWSGTTNTNNIDVLKEEKKIGFDKELFSDGGRE